MRILILEDSKERQEKFGRNTVGHIRVIVETAKACIGALMGGLHLDLPIDVLFLDHDLGGTVMQESGPGTGYEVAVWLERHPRYQPEHIVIHSFNPDGSAKMQAALPKAVRWPGCWDQDIYAIMKRLKEQNGHVDVRPLRKKS